MIQTPDYRQLREQMVAGCRLDVGPELLAAMLLSTGVHAGYGSCDFAGLPVATGGRQLFAQRLLLDATGGYAAMPTQELRLQ